LSPQGKSKQNNEKEIIKNIKGQIIENPLFNQIKPKQQKALLNLGKWRLKSWTEIGISAGLSEVHARTFYRFLCSYAHAGSMSVLQIRQAETAEQQRELCGATMGLAMITMAYLVKSYCVLFDKSKNYLDQNEEFRNYIKMWVEIGSTEIKDVDVDWEKLSF